MPPSSIDPRTACIRSIETGSIRPAAVASAALHDYPLPRAICIGAFCEAQDGELYYKFSVAYRGIYLAARPSPTSSARTTLRLMDTCNPRHVVGSGWIATPYVV